MHLLAKLAGTDQLSQGFDGLLFIGSVSNQGDGGPLHNAQGQDTQQALGVNAVVCTGDGDVAGELVGLFDEKCGGVIQVLIGNMYDYSFSQQIYHPRTSLWN